MSHTCQRRAMFLASIAFMASGAHSTTIAYEGFSGGPRPNLDGSGGGVGWTQPWLDYGSSEATEILTSGLTYPNLRSSPGAAYTPPASSFGAADYMRAFQLPPSTNHVYISFLMRTGPSQGGYGGISFGGFTQFGMPLTMSSYGLRLGHYLFVDTGISVVADRTDLLVLELTVANGQTTYSLYVNPDLARGEPANANATHTLAGTILPTQLYLTNGGDVVTDEIRIATTWSEATPAPLGGCFTVTGPHSTSGCLGGTAAFTVVPQGSLGPFAYQWFCGPSLLHDGDTGTGSTIAGSGGSTLNISGISASDLGFYYCVVTDPCGTRSSGAANLGICRSDFNCDGGIDGSDVESFFLAWEAGNVAADINSDGGIDGSDIEAFFTAWEAGAC